MDLEPECAKMLLPAVDDSCVGMWMSRELTWKKEVWLRWVLLNFVCRGAESLYSGMMRYAQVSPMRDIPDFL